MKDMPKSCKVLFVCACIVLLIGLAIIAIAEPLAFSKANAEYPMGKWAWYNEYRSYIYETSSTNIKTIGMILSVLGAVSIVLIPLTTIKNKSR